MQSHSVPDGFADSLGRLTFSPVHGFLKGFIDSVVQHKGRFYLIDWKSNLLGTDPEDYHKDRLGTVMARDYYVLQYHLYALALHAYLERRVPHYSAMMSISAACSMFFCADFSRTAILITVFFMIAPTHGFIQTMAQALIDTGADACRLIRGMDIRARALLSAVFLRPLIIILRVS